MTCGEHHSPWLVCGCGHLPQTCRREHSSYVAQVDLGSQISRLVPSQDGPGTAWFARLDTERL